MVSVDLFAGGDEPVTWAKPVTPVFSVATDKARYDPGDDRGPRAPEPVPDGARAGDRRGAGGQPLRVARRSRAARPPSACRSRATCAPRVPVHFLLMRGRLPGTAPAARQRHRPRQAGDPRGHRLARREPGGEPGRRSSSKHPENARPGQKIDVTIALKDPKGAPLAGEVTLWLVDQAVLALGQEQRLDPLPDFLAAVRLAPRSLRDTRNLVFGVLPFAENPGGDGGAKEAGLLDRATVRKNFKSVPYYNPAIVVGPDGIATVTVAAPRRPDQLQAARQGGERAGALRLRHVARRGAAAGDRAAGAAALRAAGRPLHGRRDRPGRRGRGRPRRGGGAAPRASSSRVRRRRELDLGAEQPERIEFPVTVPTPPRDADGQPVVDRGARSAWASSAPPTAPATRSRSRLPVRDDRERRRHARSRTWRRARRSRCPRSPRRRGRAPCGASSCCRASPALVRMAAGLDFLRDYPYGCTEQRIEPRARLPGAPEVPRRCSGRRAARSDVRSRGEGHARLDPRPSTPSGLVAYWPGSPGYVSLTAWTVQFLVEAKAAGLSRSTRSSSARLLRTLEQALRSDYSRFVDGESVRRARWALVGAGAGRPVRPRLRRRAGAQGAVPRPRGRGRGAARRSHGARSAAAAVDALSRSPGRRASSCGSTRARRSTAACRSGGPRATASILPSETRTLAEVARALARADPRNAAAAAPDPRRSSPSAATTAGARRTPTPRRSWRSPSCSSPGRPARAPAARP